MLQIKILFGVRFLFYYISSFIKKNSTALSKRVYFTPDVSRARANSFIEAFELIQQSHTEKLIFHISGSVGIAVGRLIKSGAVNRNSDLIGKISKTYFYETVQKSYQKFSLKSAHHKHNILLD